MAVVVGGCGALGRALVKKLVDAGVKTVSVDLMRSSDASHSIELAQGLEWYQSGAKALEQLKGDDQYHSIFHVAGGWAGGSVSDPGFLESVDKMWKFNLQSAALASYFAGHLLQNHPSGLIVLTGAAAALQPTSGMLGYGVSKTSTHFLVKSLAAEPSLKQTTSLAILPTTIDTPGNRAAMPQADFTSWTKPEEIASRLLQWSQDPKSRPPTGSLMKITTEGGTSQWIAASSS